MTRHVTSALALLALTATLAFADPGVRVDYPAGTPRVRLDGDWSGSHYTVARAGTAAGDYQPLTQGDVLCTGECYALDPTAALGSTYWYRFDLELAGGGTRRYGPFAITLAPELSRGIRLAAGPQPARGAVTFQLGLAGAPSGAPVDAEARVFDAGGRLVATVFHGPLSAGTTRIAWTPRDARGGTLASGVYLVRLATRDGRRAVTRLTIVR